MLSKTKTSNYNIEPYINKFQDYTNTFLTNATDPNTIENIQLKITHSLNVFKHAQDIAQSLNLDKCGVFISQLAGLFHDIGRFEQFTKYKTFRDEDSIYHGKLGETILRETDLLSDLDSNIFEIICQTTYNHGLIEIEHKDKASMLYSRLVRDADKMDIYRIVIKYYLESGPRNVALEYGLQDKVQISKKVLEKFKNKCLIHKDELKVLNDFKVMQLAWIFDINFTYSKNYIIKKQYPYLIVDTLNGKNCKKQVTEILNNFVY